MVFRDVVNPQFLHAEAVFYKGAAFGEAHLQLREFLPDFSVLYQGGLAGIFNFRMVPFLNCNCSNLI